MVDEQKLRKLADQLICHPVSRSIEEIESAGEAIKTMLDELQTLREERTTWRVTAENAEAAVKQARIDALEEAKQRCAEKWRIRSEAGFPREASSARALMIEIESLKETP